MKLENKFFKAFFWPFLVGIISSSIIVFVILFYYSNDFLDKTGAEDIYKLEKKYATMNINSINVILSNTLSKIQIGIYEQLSFYQSIASKLTPENKENNTISEDVKNVKYLLDNNMRESDRIDYLTLWFVNNKKKDFSDTKEEKLTNLYQQVATVSKLTHSLYSTFSSLNDVLLNIYYYFEDTELFIAYPFKYYYDSNIIQDFYHFEHNPSSCIDNDGKLIKYYRINCRDPFVNIKRIKDGVFDINEKDQLHRKIYITHPYYQFNKKTSDEIFTFCVKFNDNIGNNDAYICSDIKYNNLFDSFDNINEKLIGYFSIVSIGLNSPFYFPQMFSYGSEKTLGEYIFRWDKDYYLEEKLDFLTISNLLTSNYYNKLDKESLLYEPMKIFNELIIDDSNGENQFFYLNQKKYYYSIFPVFLQNYKKQYEHDLSIIYIFNKQLYYQHMLNFKSQSYSKLIFQIFIFAFFGIIILYLVFLGFNLTSKFIVIPIKNVRYMLEGINIGGEKRLDFLNNLQKKQEDNLEKLNKINCQLIQKNNIEKNKESKNIIKNRRSKYISKTFKIKSQNKKDNLTNDSPALKKKKYKYDKN